MTPKIVASLPELVAAVCQRRDEVGVTNSTIDEIAGLPDRYASKVLGPAGTKQFGEMSLRSVLDALAMGVAVVVLVEDDEQVARMRKRWTQRKRPLRRQPSTPAKRCVVLSADPCDLSSIETEVSDGS